MVRFTVFMSIWLSVFVTISVFVGFLLPRFQIWSKSALETGTANNGANHFSVRWLGFVPKLYNTGYAYNDTYPDYYVCINDLKDSVLTMNVAMEIQNFENSSYYFSIGPYGAPPTGWAVTTYRINNGYAIDIDQTLDFTYSNISRSRPTSILEGRLTESVQLVVQAFRDPSYTDLYSQDDFVVTFHFIDKTSPAWTILSYENGEGYPFHDWWNFGGCAGPVSYEKYRSWPNSLRCSYAKKFFNSTGPFSEVYFICPVYVNNYWTPMIAFNYTGLEGTVYFLADTPINTINTWYQLTVPVPLNVITEILFFPLADYLYIDDVYLIAK